MSPPRQPAATNFPNLEAGPEATLPFVKYRPDQARAPRGTSEGGQWVDEGGGGSGSGSSGSGGSTDNPVLSDALPDDVFLPGSQVAQTDATDRYRVNIEQEDSEFGGHTVSRHVARPEAELLEIVRRDRYEGLFITVARKSQGTFNSLDDANFFVNRVLELNAQRVDAVASGAVLEDELDVRFGYATGKEAFRPHADAEPVIRHTYSVRVRIQADKRSLRGYRVFSAYPINSAPETRY